MILILVYYNVQLRIEMIHNENYKYTEIMHVFGIVLLLLLMLLFLLLSLLLIPPPLPLPICSAELSWLGPRHFALFVLAGLVPLLRKPRAGWMHHLCYNFTWCSLPCTPT